MQLFGFNQDNIKKIKHYTYNTSDVVGMGNFSKVYKAINTKTSQIVAIKVISLQSLKEKHLQNLIYDQISILRKCKHPNIIKFHEAITEEKTCYIITELCNEGNLESRLNQKKWFSQQELNNIVADVYEGLLYLKQLGVCHRDIKAANIFMKGGRAKIADFGLAKFYKQKFKDLDIGSPLYMSPEGIVQNIYGQKTDVWAFGIFIYELLHGTSPFVQCKTNKQLVNAVMQPIPQHKFNSNIPGPMKDLIRQILIIDERSRPTINQLSHNSYLRSILNNNGNQTVRRTSNSGLKLVQSSKVSHNKSGSQISKPNQKTPRNEIKIHVMSEYLSQKTIVELGGGGPNKNLHTLRLNKKQDSCIQKNVKQYKQIKAINNKNYYMSHQPVSLKQLSTEQSISKESSGFGSINDIKRYRFNSTQTIETKQSEEDGLFLKRGRGCPAHLRK